MKHPLTRKREKMDLRKFLSPNKFKILFTIIFFVLTQIVWFFSALDFYQSSGGGGGLTLNSYLPCVALKGYFDYRAINLFLNPIPCALFYIQFTILPEDWINSPIFDFPPFLSSLIYSYILGSLIYFMYTKKKSR